MARRWQVDFQPNLESRFFATLCARVDSIAKLIRQLPVTPAASQMLERYERERAANATASIGHHTPDQKEIDSALAAIDLIYKQPPAALGTLTEDRIKSFHAVLNKNSGNPDRETGVYRTHERTVGSYNCPEPGDVPILMDRFLDFINTSAALTMHPAVRAILAHFYLASIQPFEDGNGRTARAVEAYLLYNGGYYATPFYSLPAFYAEFGTEYYTELDRARYEETGLRNLVLFALQGFETELERRMGAITGLYKYPIFRQYLTELAAEGEISERIVETLTRLAADNRRMTVAQFKSRAIPWLADVYRGLTDRSVRNDLTIMRKLKLIKEIDGSIEINFRLIGS